LAFTPNPSAQNPKRKKKFENFLKQVFLSENKRKGIHQLTRHIWLRLFTKASTHILFRYAPQNIRYAETLAEIWPPNHGKIVDRTVKVCNYSSLNIK